MTAMDNYYDLFHLPVQFEVDRNLLDAHYRTIQKISHPDGYVNESSAIQLQAVQQTANNTLAYQTLKSPVKRACHLLEILNIEFDLNHYTVKDIELLMQQMSYREQLSEIKDMGEISALEKFHKKVMKLTKDTEAALKKYFDNGAKEHEFAVKNNICELQFLNKLALDLDAVEEHFMFQE